VNCHSAMRRMAEQRGSHQRYQRLDSWRLRYTGSKRANGQGDVIDPERAQTIIDVSRPELAETRPG
jgi:hypothetical protein